MKLVALLMIFLVITLPLCFAESLNLIYSDNGNLITGDGYYRVYNSLNQLWKVYNGSDTSGVLLEEYTYDPIEEKVLIKNVSNTDGSWKETVYYIFGEYVEVVNSSGTYGFTYVKHEGQFIAERRPDGSKIYYHPDHLGSTNLITDSSGNYVENSSYTPFGVIISGGETSRYDYEGKEYDETVEDYDFHFRKYKAEWGKFTQPDTLIENVYDPQLLNRYAFERNNPWRFTDEDGHTLEERTGRWTAAGNVLKGTVLYVKYTGLIYKTQNKELKNYYKEQRSKVLRGYFAKALSSLIAGVNIESESVELTAGVYVKRTRVFSFAYVEGSLYEEDIPSWDDFERDKQKLEKLNQQDKQNMEIANEVSNQNPVSNPTITDVSNYNSNINYVYGTSGIHMSSAERSKNIGTISGGGGFRRVRAGVHVKTWSARGRRYSRVIYT